ncbi:hypothetical protein DINM_001821 [Dirofilaria immitis]|nr:hypothetical protein [Dirofilaria immitis]
MSVVEITRKTGKLENSMIPLCRISQDWVYIVRSSTSKEEVQNIRINKDVLRRDRLDVPTRNNFISSDTKPVVTYIYHKDSSRSPIVQTVSPKPRCQSVLVDFFYRTDVRFEAFYFVLLQKFRFGRITVTGFSTYAVEEDAEYQSHYKECASKSSSLLSLVYYQICRNFDCPSLWYYLIVQICDTTMERQERTLIFFTVKEIFA